MSGFSEIVAREEQQQLLGAFVTNSTSRSVRSLVCYGGSSTGKSLTIEHHLKQIAASYVWVTCDECVSLKTLLQRMMSQLVAAMGAHSEEYVFDAFVTESFDNCIYQLQKLFRSETQPDQQWFIVFDKVDELVEESDLVLRSFLRFDEFSKIPNLSIIFVSRVLPRLFITSSVPQVYFQQYTPAEIVQIFYSNRMFCEFERHDFSPAETKQFWENYVKLIIDTYSSFTNDIKSLQRIMLKLWPIFTRKVETGEVKITQFIKLIKQNKNLLSSNFGIGDSMSVNDDEFNALEDDEIGISNNELMNNDLFISNLSNLSKYLIIAGYLASFNDSKYDWILFSRLKGFHKKKQQIRMARSSEPKINSKLLDPNSFDFERLLAILNAIYKFENFKKIQTDCDLFTQFSNLNSLKIFLNSNNNDLIDPRTRFKINVNFEFVSNIADDINLPILNYIMES